jgi:hypothetical protein
MRESSQTGHQNPAQWFPERPNWLARVDFFGMKVVNCLQSTHGKRTKNIPSMAAKGAAVWQQYLTS